MSTTVPTRGSPPLDVAKVRADFPILARQVWDRPLVYLDNAATTQKPRAVIERLKAYYEEDNANIHRGVHFLSQKSTRDYEDARETVRAFINAEAAREIVFVRGATEGINLVASTWGRANIGAGDEVVISGMEHHSNIVPWQMLCEEKGAKLRVIEVLDNGELDRESFTKVLSERTKLVGVVHVSNSLGTINPVAGMIAEAHAVGAKVLIDGAQAVPHVAVDVQALDCDFYVFSGHKVYGPTGVGALYGKAALLEAMPPYQGGGEMILKVSFEETLYNEIPNKFEAGTPHIAGGIGLATALDYVSALGLDAIAAHEADLLARATAAVTEIEGVRIIGNAAEKAGVLSFVLDGVHPHDIGTILDHEGVAVRAGHHCTQPVMQRFGVPATARASFGLYNQPSDVDALVRGIRKTLEVFA